MSTLLRFSDTGHTCWARVNLPNGDPIWISIATSGVIVKRSNLGIMGPVLYKGQDVMHDGLMAKNLAEKFEDGFEAVDSGISNAVLRAFVGVALLSSDSADLCARIASCR